MTNGWFDFCKMARPRSGKLTRTQCCKVSSERKVIKSHIGRLQLYSYIFYKLTVIIKLRTLIVYCLPRLTHFSVMLTVLTIQTAHHFCVPCSNSTWILVKFFTCPQSSLKDENAQKHIVLFSLLQKNYQGIRHEIYFLMISREQDNFF